MVVVDKILEKLPYTQRIRGKSSLIQCYECYSAGDPWVGRGTVKDHLGKEGKPTKFLTFDNVIFTPGWFISCLTLKRFRTIR